MKYDHHDVRNILERSSARETAVRVAVGSVAKSILAQFGITVSGFVTELGGITSERPHLNHNAIMEKVMASALFTYDERAEVERDDAMYNKLNTAIAQAYYNKEAGVRRISTVTGAGQWGSALSMACRFFDLECLVYMVKASFEQKPYRRIFMETFGATVIPAPSDTTNAGRGILAEHPDSTGSLGIAISEAIEVAATNEDTNYSIGSCLNHVLLHQTVIGLEAQKQMELAGEVPDVVIGCVGGGSNYGGLAYPFMAGKLRGQTPDMRFLATEPAACPTLTKGRFAYDFGDTAKMTPLLPMYTLGHDFVPAGIHAGGLRYHGASPLVSQLVHAGVVEARAVPQLACFDAAVQFARTELIIPAPESSHAIRAAIDEALQAKEEGKERTILFNLSGHGHVDMAAYDAYFAGKLEDFEYPAEKVKESLKSLPKIAI